MKEKPLIFRAAVLAVSCAVLCLTLTACGGEDDSRSIITAKPPESTYVPEDIENADLSDPAAQQNGIADAAPLPDDVPVNLSVAARLLTNQTNDDDGCFILYSYLDGSADIQYIDFESMSMTELDNPPKLETQNGRIPGCFGSVKPVAAADKLFIFHLGGSAELVKQVGSAGHASIIRTNRDGTGMTSITFPKGYTFQLSSAILYADGSLYFLMADDNGDNTEFILMQLDCQTLEYTELHHLEDGYTYTIEGFWDKGPLICGATMLPPATDPNFTSLRDSQQFYLFAVGMASGTQTRLATWGVNDTNYVHGSRLYFWNDNEGALYTMNADTGEETLLASGFAPDKYDYVYLQKSITDGQLRIQFTLPGGKRNSYFSVDAETGKVSQPPTDNLGENIIIYAELEDDFLVRYDEKWVHRDKLDPDLDPMSVNGGYNKDFVNMPEFALISKDSYWAGQKNFRKVKDLIY